MSDLDKRAALAERVALLTLRGVGLKEIHRILSTEDDLTLTRNQVVALKRHPRYYEVMEKEVEATIKAAQSESKLGLSSLVPDAIAVIKDMINDKHIGAIQLVFKGLGVLDPQQEGEKQAQQLTVILPGGINPNEKEVIDAKAKPVRPRSTEES